MGIEGYIYANPNRQRVISYLKDSPFYEGDLSLVRKVVIAVGDELEEIRANYPGVSSPQSAAPLEMALVERWRMDLAPYCDPTKVMQGELGGLRPDVLRVIKGIFPSISPAGVAPPPPPVSATAATVAAATSAAGLAAATATPSSAVTDANFLTPEKKGGSGKKIAVLILLLLVIVAGVAIISEPGLLAQLLNFTPNIVPDTTAPTIAGFSPSNGSVATGLSGITVSYYDNRAVNLSTVRVRIDGSWVAFTSLTSTSVECAPPATYGIHNAYVYLQDTSGNYAEASWSFTTSSLLQLAVDSMLEQLNEERLAVGLTEVQLVSPIASNYRVNDMSSNGYFSHYDLSGYLPNYFYTLLGGQYAIEENIGYLFTTHLDPDDVPSDASSLVYDMVHDDAGSNWGHRDSLLNPTNNFVDISANWTGSRLFISLHMVKSWVNWAQPPNFVNGTFSCSGAITINGSEITDVLIFKSTPSEHDDLTYNPTLEILKGEGSYSLGYLVAGVIPAPMYYESISTVRPTHWAVSGYNFSIAFNFNTIDEPGVYTVVLYAENTLGIAHPYDSSLSGSAIPILQYTLLVP